MWQDTCWGVDGQADVGFWGETGDSNKLSDDETDEFGSKALVAEERPLKYLHINKQLHSRPKDPMK